MGRQPLLYGCLPVWYIHIGVGFSVAHSDEKGNARASKGGTSILVSFHAFLFMYPIIIFIIHIAFFGNRRRQKTKDHEFWKIKSIFCCINVIVVMD